MSEQETMGAFDRIYDGTYKKTLLYVASKCGDPGDIADILQETYGELFKVLSDKGTSYVREPEAFVFRLARTRIARHYSLIERIGFIQPFSALLPREGADDGEPASWEESGTDLADLAGDRILLRQIAAHLRTKPRETRRMFYLHYALEQTTAEISRTMKIPEPAVKSRIRRTVLEIRKIYGKVGSDDE